MKKLRFSGITTLAAIIVLSFVALSLTGCPPEPHTHDWGNWVVTTPATATTPGEETRTCNTCGEKVTRPIPPTGSTHVHEYATAWSKDATQHWHECTANDGAKIDAAAHTASDWIVDQAATATTTGSQHKECTVCGYVIETETIPATPAHTHEWEWKVTTPATPTADGLETETCKTCGATNGTRPIAMLSQNQTATLTSLFGEGYTATITGYFSNTEWDGVAEKIETALNGAFNSRTGAQGAQLKNAFRTVFGRTTGITIIVGYRPENQTYETIDGGVTLYLNFNALDNTDLHLKIADAIISMRDNIAEIQ